MTGGITFHDKGNLAITSGRIVTPGGIEEDRTLVIRNGRVCPFEQNPDIRDLPVTDARNRLVIPGLAEMHIHGCGSWNFDETGPDEFGMAVDFLLEKGITFLVPTMPYRPVPLERLAGIIDNYHGPAEIPGIYLEGPFVNREKKGGLPADSIAPPDTGLLREILSAGRGRISLMTVAPELPGINAVIDLLLEAGVIPCFGHSDASFGQAAEILHRIRRLFPDRPPGMTHLFNASSPLSHKTPGLALLPFLEDLPFELNGDGVHVMPDMLRLVWGKTPPQNRILISDALITAGLDGEAIETGGPFFYAGREVRRTDGGVRYKEDGILAGSASLITDVIRNMMRETNAGWPELVFSAASAPRRFLSGQPSAGAILPGSRTDLVILDENNRSDTVHLFPRDVL